MWLEGEEALGLVGVEVGPPDREKPRMGSGFDEVLRNFQGGRGMVGRFRWEEGVGRVVLGRGIRKVSQGVAAVARDPVQGDSNSPVFDLVEGSLDPPGFDPVSVGGGSV